MKGFERFEGHLGATARDLVANDFDVVDVLLRVFPDEFFRILRCIDGRDDGIGHFVDRERHGDLAKVDGMAVFDGDGNVGVEDLRTSDFAFFDLLVQLVRSACEPTEFIDRGDSGVEIGLEIVFRVWFDGRPRRGTATAKVDMAVDQARHHNPAFPINDFAGRWATLRTCGHHCFDPAILDMDVLLFDNYSTKPIQYVDIPDQNMLVKGRGQQWFMIAPLLHLAPKTKQHQACDQRKQNSSCHQCGILTKLFKNSHFHESRTTLRTLYVPEKEQRRTSNGRWTWSGQWERKCIVRRGQRENSRRDLGFCRLNLKSLIARPGIFPNKYLGRYHWIELDDALCTEPGGMEIFCQAVL